MVYHTLSSVAARANISASTLMRRMRDGRGPRTERFGGQVAVSEASLVEWLASDAARDGRRRAA